MSIVTNIVLINNLLGEYNTSISYMNQIVEYAYSSKNDLYISYLTQHYLYAKYMLGKYEDIYEFYKIIEYEISKLNVVSTIICALVIKDKAIVDKLIKEKTMIMM